MPTKHFSPDVFEFLFDLDVNNNRAWFEKNKLKYEAAVREPFLAFIDDFKQPLAKISNHFVADPRKAGGSLFRIHRDIRFSADKTPYKTHSGAQFRHEMAKDVHAPGFYLHLEPGNVMMGAGIWHPDSDTLAKIRQSLDDKPAAWTRAKNSAIKSGFGMEGEALKRPPKGYDADHRQIEDLKRKDFVVHKTFTEKQATSAAFLDRFTQTCVEAKPFVKWLCDAIQVPF